MTVRAIARSMGNQTAKIGVSTVPNPNPEKKVRMDMRNALREMMRTLTIDHFLKNFKIPKPLILHKHHGTMKTKWAQALLNRFNRLGPFRGSNYGGDAGSRTQVRKSSITKSTCLVSVLD